MTWRKRIFDLFFCQFACGHTRTSDSLPDMDDLAQTGTAHLLRGGAYEITGSKLWPVEVPHNVSRWCGCRRFRR